MEKVSIQEASRRLNLSQASIREYARKGELKASKEPGPKGRSMWMIELPEEGWEDPTKVTYLELQKSFSHWWWPTATRSGYAHYVDNVGIEETVPVFLCGLISENIWVTKELYEDEYCPECVEKVESALASDELLERFRNHRHRLGQR